MTDLLYGRPPTVFDPPAISGQGAAVQTSPLIPGSTALESLEPGSADSAMIYAPPGVLERRYTLALTLRALKPGGRLTTMGLKDKGGSRLKKELEAFGCSVAEDAKAHHRRCVVIKGDGLTGLDDAVAAGAPRQVDGVWSQPGVFSWDRVDPGSQLLMDEVLLYQGVQWPFKGSGADLGCGVGHLSAELLTAAWWPDIQSLRLIDLDRRAVQAAQLNVTDPRASFEWADVRTVAGAGDLDFVVMNPPFHDGGEEAKRLGVAFIQKAAEMLRKGGTLYMVANRHLPYEAELKASFKKVTPLSDQGAFKLFEAIK